MCMYMYMYMYMLYTSSSSLGLMAWILSNVVSPALTSVVLMVRPVCESTCGGVVHCVCDGCVLKLGHFSSVYLPIFSSCLATYLEFSHSL